MNAYSRRQEPTHRSQRKKPLYMDAQYPEFVYDYEPYQTQMYHYPQPSTIRRRKSQGNLRESYLKKSTTEHNREIKDMMVCRLYEIADMLNDIIIEDRTTPRLVPSKSDSSSSYKRGYRHKDYQRYYHEHSYYPEDYYQPPLQYPQYYPETDRYYGQMQRKKSLQFDRQANYYA